MQTRRDFLGTTIAIFAATGLPFKATAAQIQESLDQLDQVTQLERYVELFKATPEQLRAVRFLLNTKEIGIINGPKVERVERLGPLSIILWADPLRAAVDFQTQQLIILNWNHELIGCCSLYQSLHGPESCRKAWLDAHPGETPSSSLDGGDTLHLHYSANISLRPLRHPT